MLKAILNNTTNTDTMDNLKDNLFNKFKEESIPRDYRDKMKLKANTQDNKQLMLLMEDRIDEMNEESSIYVNYSYFVKRVKDIIDSGEFDVRALKKGIGKLDTVVINLDPKEDDPQSVFERINSTGLPLELDDLIRNFVLMAEKEQEALFEDYWVHIEKHVPKSERARFFIDLLNSYTLQKATKNNSYDLFKKWAKGKDKKEVLHKLKKMARYYAAFLGRENDYPEQTNKLLKGLRLLGQTTPYVFLFRVFEDHEDKIINEKDLNNVLKLILSYSVRRFICDISSNSLKGLYESLYERTFADAVNKETDYFDALACMFRENLKKTKDDVFPDDKRFIDESCRTKLYSRNSRICKYLLGTLENNRSKEKIDVDSEDITIEHIMPQNPDSIVWREYIGEKYDYIHDTYLHTLGNVTLTGYNGSLSDKHYEEKQRILKEWNTKIAYLNKEFVESPVWNEAIINQRATRLADALRDIFPLPEWSGKDYHPVNYGELIRVTFNNSDDAKMKRPVYYEFMGEKKDVKTFIDVITGVAETLYSINETFMQELAQANAHLIPGKEDKAYKPFLTYNKEKLNNASKLNNAEIFVEGNNNAGTMVWYIGRLLELYGIDKDEFVLYCRKKG